MVRTGFKIHVVTFTCSSSYIHVHVHGDGSMVPCVAVAMMYICVHVQDLSLLKIEDHVGHLIQEVTSNF